ncbi:hypothetical protein NMY22_g7207 [Coprinellus aureogranulatus]|nr:hypothetical protein NMY22_g7207 [Coprinellus aureogranulatus]
MSASPKPIEFGVLIAPMYQWLDAVGPVDYINGHSRAFLTYLSTLAPLPETLINKAPVINWHWISTAGDLKPVVATTGPPLPPTTTFESSPQLDYLLVPGIDHNLKLSAEATNWVSLFLARDPGLLDGVKAATNKLALKTLAETGELKELNKVNWVADSRFVVDGKIWTAAGVTSGLDLAAEFSKVTFDHELVEFGKIGAEYVPNPAKPDPFAFLLQGIELK